MPRPTWASDEQTAFLTDLKTTFTDSQAKGTSRTFLNQTCEKFIELWPVEPPTDMELGLEGGDIVGAKEKKLTKYRKRIEHWFRNHTRANAGGTTSAKNTVLSLAPKRNQNLLPYQAYMCLFRDRVMAEIRTKYVEYKAALSDDATPVGWWKFAIREATQLLAGESDDVKAQVESFRKRPAQKVKAKSIDNAKLEGMEKDEAAEKVHALQQAINLLPRTGQEALKAIEAQMGFYGVLLVGGPSPETGGLVTLAIHNGRTLSLKNLFSESSEQWPVVQSTFDTFIARCFEPDLPGKLAKVYRGESESPSDTSPAPIPPNATDEASAPSAAPKAATSTSTPSPRETTLVTDEEEDDDEDDEEPDYETERQKTIARNQIIMARIKAGGTMDEVIEEIDMELSEGEEPDWLTDGLPEWMEEAREYLQRVCEEAWWKALLEEWIAFKRALGFPDGQIQRNWLATKSRPEEVKFWIARSRQYDRPPKIKSIPTFVAGWRQWWARLQPGVRRRGKDTAWPLARELPAHDDQWAQLKRGGWNGVFMVVMTLSWWIEALGGDGAIGDVKEAAEDVKWACIAMTDPSRFTAHPEPSPAVASPRVSSAPVSPAPTAPAPTTPAPTAPAPTTPAPTAPAPTAPAPVTPAVPPPAPLPPAPTVPSPSEPTTSERAQITSQASSSPEAVPAAPSATTVPPTPASPETTSPALVSPAPGESAPALSSSAPAPAPSASAPSPSALSSQAPASHGSPAAATAPNGTASEDLGAPSEKVNDGATDVSTSLPPFISPPSEAVCEASAAAQALQDKILPTIPLEKEIQGADLGAQVVVLGGGGPGSDTVAGEGTPIDPTDSSANPAPPPAQDVVMSDVSASVATSSSVTPSPSSAALPSSTTSPAITLTPHTVAVSSPAKRVAPDAGILPDVPVKKARVE